MTTSVPAYLERGEKLVFAGALEWPGWCRRGKSEAEALDALGRYAARYADVAGLAGQAFPWRTTTPSFEIVERLDGGSGTDFGVAGLSPEADGAPVGGAELERQVRLLEASWAVFDRVASGARGRELAKGPRGGGRNLEKIELHVREAEDAYLNQLGNRPFRRTGDVGRDREAHRNAVLATLRARASGSEPPDPSGTKKRWPPRRFVRRACWHILDHAWEIEDRLQIP